ncbi:C25 family cysteine peptidase, partial [Chloroflexus sp.]|uniref:C25 family cysteine peptidase n=1 Tax=Chloroflexus sp. TaxID=1904827 RepID=UPI00404A3E29
MRRLCLFFVAAALFIVVAPATWAQPSTGLILHQRPDGVEIVWTADQVSEPQRLLLYLTADASPSPVLRELQDRPLNRPLALPSLPTVVVDGEPRPPLPSFAPEPPTAPLRLLGEGYRQGMRSALYEISPYYRTPNGPRQALRLRAFVAGAMLAPTHHQPAVGLSSAPLPDPIAARLAWTIDVTAEGVQEIDAHTLRSLGLDLDQVVPTQLRLYRAGRTLPLEPVIGGTSVTALRFYAPPPGDRWSASDRYWLTAEPGASLNLMASRTAQPLAGDVPAGITVSGIGPDEVPTIYESTLAGFDGDYFFRRQLDASAGAPVSTTLTITQILPFATGGPMQVTFELATLVRHSGTHRLRVTAGNGWSTSLEWSGHGSHRADITLPSPTTVLTLTLDPISGIDRIYLDRLLYQAPAQINLTSAGAIFSGQAGRFAYPLTGIAPGSAVYDISDPYQPVRLYFSGTTFADDAPASRRYLVTGSATLHTPLVARHNPVDVTTPRQARAIYIAPRALIGELEPLLVRRQAQGWSPLAIAVEDVYAGWSGGEPDPRAIRDFLRYAAATWSPAPEAVILVGDGSSDPRDYLRRGWPTRIPPYLAEVDPWLGETACEACFAQLDGDDPTAETLFQADLWIGRLPVKTAEELRRLVAKMLAYEQSRGAWQRHAVYLADNPD